ncbi:phosphopantetheine-binding protein [Vibrio sp. Of7-15]|uniref:phosphopantetheine-binding protein n=1 Tax=Vibrio sp. Of7-15 TaxID=2724879 RepID=UPI001EF29474|nr:phosphopantetheine-binding protein [Vibrio sp. Of7-15]MCG7500100.1 phosphopantetheine-binding protein [Vibrio sp. Of7-15]
MKNKGNMLDVLIDEIKVILNESDVRPEDNFIEIGGNSIMAINICARLEERNFINVNLEHLLGEQIGNVVLMKKSG